MKYCVNCGAAVEDDVRFCTVCGATVDSTPPTVQVSSPEAGPFSPPPPPVGAAFNASVPPAYEPVPQPAPQAATTDAQNKNKIWIPIVATVVVVVVLVLGIVLGSQVFGKSGSDESPDTATSQDAAEQEAAKKPVDVQYSTYYVVNCKESISLRESPDVSSPAMLQIPFGAAVSVTEVAENGFYKVIYNGHTGYALASYLDTVRQDTPVQTVEAPTTDATYTTMYVVDCNEWITLRSSPSTSASEITKIPLGATVSYVSTAPDGFYKVIYLGKTGYALASYLSTTPGSGGRYSHNNVYYKVVNCKEWISLRTAPSVEADRYCTIPLGATVTYYSNAGNGFLKVGYNGYVGYALASYLTPK